MEPPLPADELPLPGGYGQYRFPAMGCEFALLVPGGMTRLLAEAGVKAQELVEWIEQTLSVHRPGSDVSLLNARAASEPVAVAGAVAELLPRCIDWHVRTSGAYDFTTGPLARVWGFRTRTPRVPAPSEIAAALERTGAHRVQWDPSVPSVRFACPGVEIDFNGIGKGYAMQVLGTMLRRLGAVHALVHGGQSSVLALGNEGGARGAPGWRIGISDPVAPRARLAEVLLCDESLATSGSARQVLVHQGNRYGHVLDPRTGWPARHWLSATVVHPDAAVCDLLSTAAFVMRREEVDALAERHPDVGILAAEGGTDGRPVSLRVWNMVPVADDRPTGDRALARGLPDGTGPLTLWRRAATGGGNDASRGGD